MMNKLLIITFMLSTVVTGLAFALQQHEVTAHPEEHGHQHQVPVQEENQEEHEDEHQREHQQPDQNHASEHDEHSLAEHSDHDNESEHEEEGAVNLSSQQLAMANITLAKLKYYHLAKSAYAPGEIKANGYQSYVVSSRVNSVVIKRYAVLGEHVKARQPLVGLFSEEMVTAQSELQEAATEWFRVRKLGQRSVGEQRYVSARTRYNAAFGRLKVYGIDDKTIALIAKDEDYPLGEYTLTALADGVVMQDDFNRGQRVEAGQALLLISDETRLWVEARLSAHNNFLLSVGDTAQVMVGDMLATASIIQEAHTIDPVTRTRTVRMNLDNQNHQFHAGMFADIYFRSAQQQKVIAVPESALMRNTQGQWQIFIRDDDGDLLPVSVTLGDKFGEYQQISGVEAGQTYVASGAFFVASEIAKGGFDPHNH